jgi:8-oxo-dGTP diphosphatase
MTLMVVVAAVLTDVERGVLVAERPAGKEHAGLWEFPGGKVEPGETPEAALVRELHEELGIHVDPASLSPITFVSEPRGERHLLLMLYRCTAWRGEPQALDAAAIRWVELAELGDLAMPPADLAFARTLAAER